MPNGEIIYSTNTALLPNRDLPLESRICHIFPGLNKYLTSIGVLCDLGCMGNFDNKKVITTKKKTNRVLIQGGQNE